MKIEPYQAKLNQLLFDRENRVIALTGKWGTGKTYLWETVNKGRFHKLSATPLY